MADARFAHRLRPSYADVDRQGVVFFGHWLTYFDDALYRFLDWLGFPPKPTVAELFDVMVVKVVVEWQSPAGFDDEVEIAVTPIRLGNSSFDLRYDATVAARPACTGTITYVSVKPGTAEPIPIPEEVRARLEAAAAG